MANYNTLISAIRSVIAENGNNEITGNILQQTLVAMIGALGGGYQFAGIATPSTTPGTPDEKIFYLGSSGTYPNFGPAVIQSGNIGVFWYDTSWHVGTIEFPIGEGEITKSNLSQSLLNELLNGFVYAGIATPTGNPGSPLRDSFYMTTTPGTYTNYGNLTVQDEEIAIFRYVVSTGIWSKDSIALPETTEIVNNVYEGGTDKALSAQMGKYLNDKFGETEEPIFINSSSALWEVGSINDNGAISTYANRIIILALTHNVKASGGIHIEVGPFSSYTIDVLTSASSTNGYILSQRFSASNTQQQANINIAGVNYVALVVWDKPSTATAQSIPICISTLGSGDPVLRYSDIVDGFNGSNGNKYAVLSADAGKLLYELINKRLWFTNSSSAEWKSGSIDAHGNITTYANQRLILSIPQEVKQSGKISISVGPFSGYTLDILGSVNETTGYANLQRFQAAQIPQIAEIDISNENYLALIFWDKPNIAFAQSVAIDITYILAEHTEHPLYSSDIPFITSEDKVLRVAASNASATSKEHADFICNGINDQVIIQQAINALNGQGTVELSEGTFNIDSFAQIDSTHYGAVVFSQNVAGNINIVGQQNTHGRFQATKLVVGQTAYNGLSDSIEYAVFRHNTANIDRHVNYENILVELYDNQKKIICFDGLYSGAINMYNCFGQITSHPAVWYPDTPPSSWVVPNIDCVFFRGTSKSQNWNCRIVLCSAYSFGIGFAVQGEHIYLDSCVAACCNYGYAFNKFASVAGTWYCHPMILVNCVDEMMHNFPSFGANTQLQSVRIINYHTEFKPGWFALGGNYATESTPGQWRGFVNYANQMIGGSPYNGKNSPTVKFWADGSGMGMVSINDAHATIATTTQRNEYAPNFGQIVYDSTLNKLVVCTNPATSAWVDVDGNPV